MNLSKEKCVWLQDQDKGEVGNWKIGEKGNMLIIQSKGDNERSLQLTMNVADSKEPWTEKEELKMIIAHNKYKNKWSEISAALKGRDNNTIKNKFYSIFRRIKGKIQKSDYTYESKLELLEIYYIISLIEFYLDNPMQNPKTKGKRGKDFIYTLVHNLTKDIVRAYKEHIKQLAKDEGTMEDLFKILNTEYRLLDIPPLDLSSQIIPTPPTANPSIPLLNSGTTVELPSNAFPQPTPHIPLANSIPKINLPPFSFQTTNQGSKPLPASPLEESKQTSKYLAETIPNFRNQGAHISNRFDTSETYFGQLKASDLDIPLNIDFDFAQPVSLFSPPTLSAGPAAAAAGASRAACFSDIPADYNEFSSIARRAKEEQMRQITEFNYPGNSTREGNKEQPLAFTGLQYKPYFHQ